MDVGSAAELVEAAAGNDTVADAAEASVSVELASLASAAVTLIVLLSTRSSSKDAG